MRRADQGNPFARLYAVPLADFVSTRKTIATELKKSGDPELAAKITEARKPTATAWAMNQIAHRHPKDLTRFIDAIEALRIAQRELLEAPAAKVAEAKTRFRTERNALNERVADLVKLARAALESDGGAWNLAAQKRISATLHVLPLASAEDRSKLIEGRLEKDLDASTDDGAIESAFGPVDEVPKQHEAAKREIAKEAEKERKERAHREAEHRAHMREMEHKADEAEREAKRLDAEATKAEAVAIRARGDADRAKARAKEARDGLPTLRRT